LLREESPDKGVTSYAYDPANGTTSKQESGGVAISYRSDVLDRQTMIDLPGTADDVAYGYDQGGAAANGLGQQTSVIDGAETTAYVYDTKGRATGKSVTISALNHAYNLSQSFSANGRLKQIVYPSGRTVDFGYDSQGRVVSLTTTGSGVTKTIFNNITYQPFGGVADLGTAASSLSNQTGSCGCGVTTSNPGAGTELNYDYYPNNNLQSLTYTHLPQLNEAYEYNEMGRLTKVSKPAGVFNYTYDQAGNRLTTSAVGKGVYDNGPVWARTTVDEVYAYLPGSNQLNQITRNITLGSTTTHLRLNYSYGTTGNIGTVVTTNLGTSVATTRILSYDSFNRLKSVADNGVTKGSYTYNAYNQRVSKTATAGTTYFLYDFDGNLLAEVDGTGAVKVEYIYSGGQIVARVDNGSDLYFYHNDRLGSPKMVSKVVGSGHVAVWEATYTPFGQALVNNNTGIVSNLRFPGQYYDAETGLHYNYNRYYDPGTGRYVTADPIGLGGGINPFNFTSNNPVNKVDPLGLDAIVISGGQATYYNMNGNIIGTYQTSSGNGTASASQAGGPTPPGFWSINPSDVSPSGFFRQYIDPRDWGDYRVTMNPDPNTNTYGRTGIFLHGGHRPGSVGCEKVTDPNQNDLFHNILNAPGPIPVIVMP